MRRKPIFEYRVNREECSESDVIGHANLILRTEYDQIGIDIDYIDDIADAIHIIRANDETVEYLGI
ncbi:MAG: hypothetical protein ACXAAH_05560 [Promethearchaeota archaeon]|jgi:hypothetical protein